MSGKPKEFNEQRSSKLRELFVDDDESTTTRRGGDDGDDATDGVGAWTNDLGSRLYDNVTRALARVSHSECLRQMRMLGGGGGGGESKTSDETTAADNEAKIEGNDGDNNDDNGENEAKETTTIESEDEKTTEAAMTAETSSTTTDEEKFYTLEEVQRRFVEIVPFVSARSLHPEVIESLREAVREPATDPLKRVRDVYNAFKSSLGQSSDGGVASTTYDRSALILVNRVAPNDAVTYYRASVKREANGRVNYYPPRFRIKVGQVAPNSSVRVNTGYTIDMPNVCKRRRLVDGALETESSASRQTAFVIAPVFVLDKKARGDDVLPTIFARDAEDRGMLCLTFTTLTGNVGTLTVVLKAFELVSPGNFVNIINAKQADAQTFKNKDFKNGRSVANPKIGYHPETMRTSAALQKVHAVEFTTFDKETRKVQEEQRLRVTGLNTLVSSRKREWFDDSLVSTCGLYVRGKRADDADATLIEPRLYATARRLEQRADNTHCLCFVSNARVLFDDVVVPERGAALRDGVYIDASNKLINGAMYDLSGYEYMNKSLRQVTRSIALLRYGVQTCMRVTKKLLGVSDTTSSARFWQTFARVMRVYDYHHSVSETDPRLLEYMEMTDEELYNSRKLTETQAFSASLYKGLLTLARRLFIAVGGSDEAERKRVASKKRADDDTASSSSSGDEATTTTKRKRDEADNTDDEKKEDDADTTRTTTTVADPRLKRARVVSTCEN